MSAELTISEAIEHLVGMAQAAREAEQRAMARACAMVRDEARRLIGHSVDSEGPFPPWPPLAAATQRERVHEGLPADTPLLRDGALRDSIAIAVDTIGGKTEGVVGSDSTIAVFQELGTDRIPPRSFLGAAAFRVAEAAAADVARGVVGGLHGDAARSGAPEA